MNTLDFDEKERQELKKFFDSLDKDKSGAIGVEELEEPMIALGLAESKEQVAQMIAAVDLDKSGQIEFKEFLEIIKGSESNSTMTQFFKKLINGSLIENAEFLPFNLVISTYRRKRIMDAMFEKNNTTKKQEGEKVLNAFIKQLEARGELEERKQQKESINEKKLPSFLLTEKTF